MDRHTEYRDDDGLHVPYRACDVVNEGCKAPPALAGSFTKATCFACGMPVCTSPGCSGRIQWHSYGRRRVCAKCSGEAKRLREDEQREAQNPYLGPEVQLSNKSCPNYYGTMMRGSFRGSKGCDCPEGRCWYNEQVARRRAGKAALKPDPEHWLEAPDGD